MTAYEAPTQAPKGGAVSSLNGEFYKGGQFMCNQFAMPKGYTKHLKRAVTMQGRISSNIALIQITATNVRIKMAGDDRTACVFTGERAQCEEFVTQLLAAKTSEYVRRGFAPHPTEVVYAT